MTFDVGLVTSILIKAKVVALHDRHLLQLSALLILTDPWHNLLLLAHLIHDLLVLISDIEHGVVRTHFMLALLREDG